MRRYRVSGVGHSASQWVVRPLEVLLLAAVLATATWTGIGTAGELTRFQLDDGSIIVGEPLGLADGIFRIRTRTLGDIDVEVARIRRMERADAGGDLRNDRLGADAFGAAGQHAAPEGYAGLIQALQQSMVADSGIMELMTALQQDPEIQRAIGDPELIGLMASGDVEALRNHEAFGRLMGHPGIRAIIEQMIGRVGGLR